MAVSGMIDNVFLCQWKSEQQCFQEMSSSPFFMSVGDHGDLYGACADFCSAWSRPLVMSLPMES